MRDRTNILVVDDEEVVRLSFRRTLASDRCSVKLVDDGAKALQAMAENPYDVVLLDLRMPGMGGMDVLKTIKERWPRSEVIVVTGYGTVETAKEAVSLGAYDFLPKPVGPDEIVTVANRAIQHKQWALHRETGCEHRA